MPDDMPMSRAIARATRRAAPCRALRARLLAVAVFAAACLLSFASSAAAAGPPAAAIAPPFLAAPGELVDSDAARPAVAATSTTSRRSRRQVRRRRRAGAPAMMRLVNRMRRQRGLRRIRTSRRIAAAAAAHSSAMARQGFFSHVAPGGATPADRLARVGYSRVRVGEVLAWGCGKAGRPSAILRSWLNSPPHLAVLTDPGWRVAGVGAISGIPGGACAGGRTWTMGFAGG